MVASPKLQVWGIAEPELNSGVGRGWLFLTLEIGKCLGRFQLPSRYLDTPAVRGNPAVLAFLAVLWALLLQASPSLRGLPNALSVKEKIQAVVDCSSSLGIYKTSNFSSCYSFLVFFILNNFSIEI